METLEPPINEAVGFLAKFAPDSLNELRKKLPAEIRPLLSPGGLAGRSDKLLLARAEVAKAALAEIASRCQEGIALAERRLKLSRRIRLLGEIAAVLGSASVVTTALATPGSWIILSGTVALVGSLATVIAEYAVKLPQDKLSLFETYAWLVEARFEAVQMAKEIAVLIDAGAANRHEAALTELIGKGNVLCREAHRRLASLLSEGAKAG
jgi:hypothetical protein